MSKFHSTVSRRDFMKGLGLAGAGIGAAAAAAPVFHDLDEAAASPQAGWHRPWYVKQLDFEKPSVDIDWARMQPRDKTKTDPDGGGSLYSFLYRGSQNPQSVAIRDAGATDTDPGTLVGKWIQERIPGTWQGDDIKNRALDGAVGRPLAFYNFAGQAGNTWFLGLDSSPTPESRGMSKWTGTQEEANKILRAASRFFGAQDVGVVELTANVKKLIVAKGSRGKSWEFSDSVAMPEETDTKYIVPTRFKYIINYTNLQSTELTPRQPSILGKTATYMSYNHWPRIKATVQQFLRGLGYRGVNLSSDIPSNAVGMLSGVGEHTRMGNPVISPEYGGHMRAMSRMLTDLPLEPTKPIDAGIARFCVSCKICAENCPTDALMMGDPSYEADAQWNPRVLDVPYAMKGWQMNNYRCIVCGACQGYCPFNSTKHSPIHSLVFATVSYVPMLNAFNAEMQRFFNYGFKDPDTWWDLDDPVYGISPKFTGKTL